MPKRKDCPDTRSACPPCPPSLTSLDAALDLLACDTFTRLHTITSNFEQAAKVKLQDGIIKNRWEEAVKRYWLMRSLDDLTCSSTMKKLEAEAAGEAGRGRVNGDSTKGTDCDMDETDRYERPMPCNYHPGAVEAFGLNADEEAQWRRWSPKVGDMVLIDLPDNGGKWPGKVIDKKVFFQGRTVPRGSHFFPVRIYNEDMAPTATIKARLVPLDLRPTPPLLASSALLSAYNQAINPTTFDMLAAARESLAARTRTQPPVGDDPIQSAVDARAQKEVWKKFVNWLMDERRVEKMRSLAAERERRVREVSRSEEETVWEGEGEADSALPKKKRPDAGQWSDRPMTLHKVMTDSSTPDRGGIFRLSPNAAAMSGINGGGIHSATPSPTMIGRSSSPGSMAAYIRPALSAPRPASPRRTDRRRPPGTLTDLGEYSPRRAMSYVSGRTLPSGDEMAPQALSLPAPAGGIAPSLKTFDFVSPLGPVRLGRLSDTGDGDMDGMSAGVSGNGFGGNTRPGVGRSGSLEAVREEAEDDGEWTLVTKSRGRRAGSEPPPVQAGEGKAGEMTTQPVQVTVGEPDGMDM